MRLLLMILLPGLLLLGVALVLIWLPLPAPFPAALSGGRNLLAAVISGGLGLAYLVGLAFFVASSVRRAGHALEALMLARGLKADSHLGWDASIGALPEDGRWRSGSSRLSGPDRPC